MNPPPSDTAVALREPVLSPPPVPQVSALRAIRARGPLRGRLAMLGPAFVAAVAYIDPGNFATNIAGGAKYGFLLVWVIVAANLMAMLVQYLSAKVGVATGRSLPELCREHFPRPVTWGLWGQAEVIAIATDLAERGIAPGDPFEVIEKHPFGGPLFASFGDAVHVLGGQLADAMRVEVDA